MVFVKLKVEFSVKCEEPICVTLLHYIEIGKTAANVAIQLWA